jgi:hypothetical protein
MDIQPKKLAKRLIGLGLLCVLVIIVLNHHCVDLDWKRPFDHRFRSTTHTMK